MSRNNLLLSSNDRAETLSPNIANHSDREAMLSRRTDHHNGSRTPAAHGLYASTPSEDLRK